MFNALSQCLKGLYIKANFVLNNEIPYFVYTIQLRASEELYINITVSKFALTQRETHPFDFELTA